MAKIARKQPIDLSIPFGLSGKTAIKDFAKRVRGTASIPVALTTDAETTAWTCLLLTQNSFDMAEATAALNKLTDWPVDHYGSHSLKVPDANMMSDRPGFFAASTPEGILGVAGVTPSMHRKFSGIGNAERSPYHRVLSAVYRDGETDVVMSVLDDILQNGRVLRALQRLGDVKPVIQAARAVAKRREAGCDAEVIGAENKVVLWPMVDGDYLALTPITNLALMMDLKERIDARKQADETVFFPDRAMKVGGTKPQNAGIIASDRAGWFRLLSNSPPTIFERPMHLLGLDKKLAEIVKMRFLPGTRRTRLMRDRLIDEIVGMIARHLSDKGSVISHETVMRLIRSRAVAVELNDYEFGRFANQIDAYQRENR